MFAMPVNQLLSTVSKTIQLYHWLVFQYFLIEVDSLNGIFESMSPFLSLKISLLSRVQNYHFQTGDSKNTVFGLAVA